MNELTAIDAARQLRDPIGGTGGEWLLAPEVLADAKERGYPNRFSYYFVGRGGVLGDVDADVVTSAFGFFKPELVRKMWESGVGVEGPRAAARRYGVACAEYGRARLASFAAAGRYVELAERLVDGAPIIGLPLFTGWRAEPRPDDVPARAYFLTQILREWRGSAHVAAVASSGLSALESILTSGGPGQATFFGWGEAFADASHLAEQRDACEVRTDEVCAVALEATLTPAERGELVELARELASVHRAAVQPAAG